MWQRGPLHLLSTPPWSRVSFPCAPLAGEHQLRPPLAAFWATVWFPADACGLCRGSEGTMKTRVHLGTFWKTTAEDVLLFGMSGSTRLHSFFLTAGAKIRVDLTLRSFVENQTLPFRSLTWWYQSKFSYSEFWFEYKFSYSEFLHLQSPR